MNKKGIFISVVIVVFFSALLSLFLNKDEKIISNDFKIIEYYIDNKEVKIDGKNITYFGNELKKDFNKDGLEDVAFLIVNNSEGSGTFYYLVAAINTKNGYIGTNAMFLGDRIAPQNINYINNEIVVNYADRKIDEPFTTKPSVGVSKYFTVKDFKLIENKQNEQVIYENIEYSFSVILPNSWKNYSIMNDKWSGDYPNSAEIEQGSLINIRHPQWTNDNPRQDIPVMIFTLDQWNNLEIDKFHIGAAPINPKELARNDKYIFALPARYNFAFLTGYEEVDTIINSGAVVDSAWLKIKSAIETCNVKEIMQAHSKQVSIELKDGTKMKAYEPKIDEIMDITVSAENKCGKIIMATE